MSTHYLALNLPEKIQVDSWGEAQRPVLKQSQEGRLTYPEVKETLVRTRSSCGVVGLVLQWFRLCYGF